MAPHDNIDHRQRADDNERLRKLAAEEIASLRTEMARMVEGRVGLDAELLALAEHLSLQRVETERVIAELEETKAELAESKGTIDRQHVHIAGLKKQNSRPLRLLVKKVLRAAGVKRSGDA